MLSLISLISFLSLVSCQVPLWGVNYGPQRVKDVCTTDSQVNEDIIIMSKYTNRIKTFSLTNGGCPYAEKIIKSVEKNNLTIKLYLGMWLDGRQSQYSAEKRELGRLIEKYPRFMREQVATLIVGSETLFRRQETVQSLISKVAEMRAIISTYKMNCTVSIAEQGDFYTPELIKSVDYVMPNLYPFWGGIDASQAVKVQSEQIGNIKKRGLSSKQVITSELGWPSGGDNVGGSVPSLANAEKFFKGWVCFEAKNDIPYFYFEFFDEHWKPEHSVERYWGIFYADRKPKFNMNFSC